MRHAARSAHQRPVELGRGATVRRPDAAQGGQDVPHRSVQPEAGEVVVQPAVEQGAGAADASHDRDRGGVKAWLFLLPFGEDNVDMVVASGAARRVTHAVYLNLQLLRRQIKWLLSTSATTSTTAERKR